MPKQRPREGVYAYGHLTEASTVDVGMEIAVAVR